MKKYVGRYALLLDIPIFEEPDFEPRAKEVVKAEVAAKIFPVTCWYRLNDKGVFKLNHIEWGLSSVLQPVPIAESQIKSWLNGTWQKEYAISIYSKIVGGELVN
jgi:hypothetical protein